jgi:hypothetical protein
MRNGTNRKNSVKWRQFEVPVNVEKVNDKLFSDAAKLNNTKQGFFQTPIGGSNPPADL